MNNETNENYSIVSELFWIDNRFTGKTETALICFRIRMTKQFWTYKPETIASMFGISVRHVNRIYQKMKDCDIMDADGKIIYDESKHREIIKSQQGTCRSQVMDLEVPSSGPSGPKIRTCRSQVMDLEVPSSGPSGPKSIPNSPMKTEFSKESIKEIIKESIKENSKETLNNKENPFDIFVKKGKDEGLKFEHSLPADITEFDIIMHAIESGEEYEVVQSNTETKKLGYHYEKNKHGIWYGIKETVYNERKEFYIKEYKKLLLQQS
jgi:hypothetical protein